MAVFIKKLLEGGTSPAPKFMIGDNEWVNRDLFIISLKNEFPRFLNHYNFSNRDKKKLELKFQNFITDIELDKISGTLEYNALKFKNPEEYQDEYSKYLVYFASKVLANRKATIMEPKLLSENSIKEGFVNRYLGGNNNQWELYLKNRDNSQRIIDLLNLLSDEYINSFENSDEEKNKYKEFRNSPNINSALSLGFGNFYNALTSTTLEKEEEPADNVIVNNDNIDTNDNDVIEPEQSGSALQRILLDFLGVSNNMENTLSNWEQNKEELELPNINLAKNPDHYVINGKNVNWEDNDFRLYEKYFGRTNGILKYCELFSKNVLQNGTFPKLNTHPNSSTFYKTLFDYLYRRRATLSSLGIETQVIKDSFGNDGIIIPESFDLQKGIFLAYIPKLNKIKKISILTDKQLFLNILKKLFPNEFNYYFGLGVQSNKLGGILKAQAGLELADSDKIYLLRILNANNTSEESNYEDEIPEEEELEVIEPVESKRYPDKTFDLKNLSLSDYIELTSIAADLSSLITNKIPVYGTAASVGAGLLSTALHARNLYADDNKFDSLDLKETLINLGTDLVGAIPGLGDVGKIHSITKALKPYIKYLKYASVAANFGELSNVLIKIGNGETLTWGDLQTLSLGIKRTLDLSSSIKRNAKLSGDPKNKVFYKANTPDAKRKTIKMSRQEVERKRKAKMSDIDIVKGAIKGNPDIKLTRTYYVPSDAIQEQAQKTKWFSDANIYTLGLKKFKGLKKLKNGGIILFLLNGNSVVTGVNTVGLNTYSMIFNDMFNNIAENLKNDPNYWKTLNLYLDTYRDFSNQFAATGDKTKGYRFKGVGDYHTWFKKLGYDDSGIYPLFELKFKSISNNPNSGDNPTKKLVDSIWGMINEHRTVLGTKAFWDLDPEGLANAKEKFRNLGYNLYLDTSPQNGTLVYKLNPLNKEQINVPTNTPVEEKTPINTNKTPVVTNEASKNSNGSPTTVSGTNPGETNLNSLNDAISKILHGELPNFWKNYKNNVFGPSTALSFLRLLSTLNFNRLLMKDFKVEVPFLSPKLMYRNVYGDYFALKNAENQAAQIASLTNLPFTSNAKLAYLTQLQKSKQIHDIINEGFSADNKMIKTTQEASIAALDKNITNSNEIANKNRTLSAEAANRYNEMKLNYNKGIQESVDGFLKGLEYSLQNRENRNNQLEDIFIIKALNEQYDPSEDFEAQRLLKEYLDASDADKEQKLEAYRKYIAQLRIVYANRKYDILDAITGTTHDRGEYNVTGNTLASIIRK